VRLVAKGRTSKRIGADLFISPRTVDTHVRNTYRTTGTHPRTQLATWYLEGAQ
jgi:DNA-binding NarL/FixJ family response regulator